MAQLLPGHGSSQRRSSFVTVARTVTWPVMPVVFSVTSVPVVDDSLPPVVVQVTVDLPAPAMAARNAIRSPSVTVEADAVMLQVTAGQGGSVTSNEAAQSDSPVVAQPDG